MVNFSNFVILKNYFQNCIQLEEATSEMVA